MKTMVTLLKREFWENRGGFFRAPAVVAAFFILCTLLMWIWAEVTVGRTGIKIDNLPIDAFFKTLDPQVLEHYAFGLNAGLLVLAIIVQSIVSIVVFFYLLGSLYDERRDRSVLFWKSLPVSDSATVLSKVLSAAVIAPVLGLAAVVVLHIGMLLVASLVLTVHGISAMQFLWGPAEPMKLWVHLAASLPVHALWALPTFGWLMLVSSFARSKPFLWAVLPPLAVGLLLGWFEALRQFKIPEIWYWKHVFARMLTSIFPHSWGDDGTSAEFGLEINGKASMEAIYSWNTLGNVLANPELWAGAVAGIAMIATAIYFRRKRELAD